MAGDFLKNDLLAWGPKDSIVGWARWVPSSDTTQTVAESQGVSSITRSGAGAYTVNLKSPSRELVALVEVRENDTTHYHFARVESYTQSSNPTLYTAFSISHKSVAFASVASGPSGSDTVDEIRVVFFQRFNV